MHTVDDEMVLATVPPLALGSQLFQRRTFSNVLFDAAVAVPDVAAAGTSGAKVSDKPHPSNTVLAESMCTHELQLYIHAW